MKSIMVKYFDKELSKLEVKEHGDCIDLRVSNVVRVDNTTLPMKASNARENFPVTYKKGEVLLIGLGVGMKLPEGYKSNLYARSGLFKNFGFILVNSVGIIDNMYSGENDEWRAMVYCTIDGVLDYGERLFQFEPVPVHTKKFNYIETELLDTISRGGFGSTGTK